MPSNGKVFYEHQGAVAVVRLDDGKANALSRLSGPALAQTKSLARHALVDHVRATLDDDLRRLAPQANTRKS